MAWSPINAALFMFKYVARMNELGDLPPYDVCDYDRFVEVGLLERVETKQGWRCRLTAEGWRAYRDGEVMLSEYIPKLSKLYRS